MSSDEILKMIPKVNQFPKENKNLGPIHCRIRDPKTFIKSTYHIVNLQDGVKALVGRQKSQDNIKIQTTIFNTESGIEKCWTLREAKVWLKSFKKSLKQRVFATDIIKGVAKINKVMSPPKKINNVQLNKSVEKLREHFQCLPKKM